MRIAIFLLGIIAIPLSYAFVDRQLVLLAHQWQTQQYRVLHTLQMLPEWIVPGLPVAFVLSALVYWRRRNPKYLRATIAVALGGALSAFAIKPIKFIFARTWADTFKADNPSFLQDGVYGFFWFEPGIWYQSFPSGHTIAITTFAILLSSFWPRLRWLSVLLILTVSLSLIALYYHFVSDVLAGLYVGAAYAWLAKTAEWRISGLIKLRAQP